MISTVAFIDISARKPPMTARDAHTFTPDTLPLLLGVVGVAVLGVALAAFFALRRR